MTEFFASGHAIDLILGLMVLESLVLALYHWKTGRGIAPTDLLVNLLAGAFLLLALRGVLVQARWGWIALCLTLCSSTWPIFGAAGDPSRKRSANLTPTHLQQSFIARIQQRGISGRRQSNVTAGRIEVYFMMEGTGPISLRVEDKQTSNALPGLE